MRYGRSIFILFWGRRPKTAGGLAERIRPDRKVWVHKASEVVARACRGVP